MKHNQILGHQHNRHEIVKAKKRDSNSARSLSQSSKQVADSMNQVVNDVKNKIKKVHGNESFNSSKKVIKDEKNTSNQRSRST
jgi:predicted carbohydrate-binding protein with CBM5 and CBM33 domain